MWIQVKLKLCILHATVLCCLQQWKKKKLLYFPNSCCHCSKTKRSRSAYFLYTLSFIWMVIMTWTTLFSLWNMISWFGKVIQQQNSQHILNWEGRCTALTTFAPHVIKVHRYIVHFWLKPTPFSRVIIDSLHEIGSLVSRNTLSYMESKCSLRCSQEAIIFPKSQVR